MRLRCVLWSGLVACLQIVSSTPAGTPVQHDARAGNSACAVAASSAAAYMSAHTQAAYPTIPAQVAYNCLKSVPLEQDRALSLTNALKPYIQLQSTVDYLRNPPSGYLWDPVDLPRLLDAIETKLISKNTYDSEYDFQLDLQSAIMAARDGHFVFNGDATTVFAWIRDPDFSVVSVSLDGKKVPQVFAAADILNIDADSVEALNNTSASPIKSINGLDVVTFFLADSNSLSAQDPDNSWNTRFFSIQSFASQGIGGLFNLPTFYPGPTTAVQFQNGTTITIDNFGVPLRDLDGISTGQDFYKKFCTGTDTLAGTEPIKRNAKTLLRRDSSDDSSNSSSLYPQPEITDTSGVLAGYYLDDVDDVAVLAVSSFLPGQGLADDLTSFQDTVSDFFAEAVKAGKKKLIIDLQGNGGGSIDLAIDLAAQLFPSVPPNSKENMRASVGMYGIITAGSNLLEQSQNLDAESDASLDFNVVPFAFQEVITPDVKNFHRISDFYGPAHVGNGFFTNFFQGNYTNDSPSQYGLPGITITGTGNRTDFEQPFEAENIIMVTDGFCASACTILSEHLKLQGIQVIALGGRPQTGPMQAIGGVKGSQVFESDNIQIMLDLWNNKKVNTALSQAKGTVFENFDGTPIARSNGSVSLNGKNQFRIGDSTQTPLQFVYEAADCRAYFTPDMAASPVAIWNRVASLAFEHRQNGTFSSDFCVQNSTGQSTSIGGGLKPGSIGPQTPPSNAKSATPGFLVNGTQIVNGLVYSDITNNSPVDPDIAAQDDLNDEDDEAEVAAAMSTMVSICKGYTGKEWFVILMCKAFTQQGGGS